MKCNLCGNSVVFELIYHKDGYDIVKCKQCGLVFRKELPTLRELKEIYSPNYFFKPPSDKTHQGYLNYLEDEQFLRLNALKRLKRIENFHEKGDLLDVGCAAGFFIDEAKKRGWKAKGVEISFVMAEYGRKVLNLDIISQSFNEFYSEQKFDVITMWDYIEHSIDPMQDIKKSYTLLKPKGLLVISTGDFDSFLSRISKDKWHLLTPHHHLFYFSSKTIQRLLIVNNFRILRIAKEGNYYSLKYLLYKLAPYLPFVVKKSLVVLSNSFLGKLNIYVNLGDIMTVYAQKI